MPSILNHPDYDPVVQSWFEAWTPEPFGGAGPADAADATDDEEYYDEGASDMDDEEEEEPPLDSTLT